LFCHRHHSEITVPISSFCHQNVLKLPKMDGGAKADGAKGAADSKNDVIVAGEAKADAAADAKADAKDEGDRAVDLDGLVQNMEEKAEVAEVDDDAERLRENERQMELRRIQTKQGNLLENVALLIRDLTLPPSLKQHREILARMSNTQRDEVANSIHIYCPLSSNENVKMLKINDANKKSFEMEAVHQQMLQPLLSRVQAMDESVWSAHEAEAETLRTQHINCQQRLEECEEQIQILVGTQIPAMEKKREPFLWAEPYPEMPMSTVLHLPEIPTPVDVDSMSPQQKLEIQTKLNVAYAKSTTEVSNELNARKKREDEHAKEVEQWKAREESRKKAKTAVECELRLLHVDRKIESVMADWVEVELAFLEDELASDKQRGALLWKRKSAYNVCRAKQLLENVQGHEAIVRLGLELEKLQEDVETAVKLPQRALNRLERKSLEKEAATRLQALGVEHDNIRKLVQREIQRKGHLMSDELNQCEKRIVQMDEDIWQREERQKSLDLIQEQFNECRAVQLALNSVEKQIGKADDDGQHMNIGGSFFNGDAIGGKGLAILNAETKDELEGIMPEEEDKLPTQIKLIVKKDAKSGIVESRAQLATTLCKTCLCMKKLLSMRQLGNIREQRWREVRFNKNLESSTKDEVGGPSPKDVGGTVDVASESAAEANADVKNTIQDNGVDPPQVWNDNVPLEEEDIDRGWLPNAEKVRYEEALDQAHRDMQRLREKLMDQFNISIEERERLKWLVSHLESVLVSSREAHRVEVLVLKKQAEESIAHLKEKIALQSTQTQEVLQMAAEDRLAVVHYHLKVEARLSRELSATQSALYDKTQWLRTAIGELEDEKREHAELKVLHAALEQRRADEIDELTFLLKNERGKTQRLEMWVEALKVDMLEYIAMVDRKNKEMKELQKLHDKQRRHLKWEIWKHRSSALHVITEPDALFLFFAQSLAAISGASNRCNNGLRMNGAVDVIAALCATPRYEVKRLAVRALGAIGWNGAVEERFIGWRAKRIWSGWVDTALRVEEQKLKLLNRQFDEPPDDDDIEMNTAFEEDTSFFYHGDGDAGLDDAARENLQENKRAAKAASSVGMVAGRRRWAIRLSKHSEGPNNANQLLLVQPREEEVDDLDSLSDWESDPASDDSGGEEAKLLEGLTEGERIARRKVRRRRRRRKQLEEREATKQKLLETHSLTAELAGLVTPICVEDAKAKGCGRNRRVALWEKGRRLYKLGQMSGVLRTILSLCYQDDLESKRCAANALSIAAMNELNKKIMLHGAEDQEVGVGKGSKHAKKHRKANVPTTNACKVVKALVVLLQATDGEVVKNAASAVANLSFRSPENQHTIGITSNVIEILASRCDIRRSDKVVPVLPGPKVGPEEVEFDMQEQEEDRPFALDIDVLEASTAALANLVCQNDANGLKLARAGGISIMLYLCDSHLAADVIDREQIQEIQANAAECLGNLTRNNNLDCIGLIKEAGLSPFVLMCGSDNVLVQRHAALVIGNLALEDSCREELGDEGGVEALFLLADRPDIKVVSSSLWALGNMAWHPDNQERIGRFMKQLLTLCATNTPEIQQNGVVLLANMLFYHEDNRIRLARVAGSLQQLVLMCKSADRRVQHHATRALGTAAHNDENAIKLANLGAIDVMIQSCRVEDPKLNRYAVFALINLSVNDFNKRRVLDANGIEALVHLQNSDDLEVRRSAVDCLQILSDVPDTAMLAGKKADFGVKGMVQLCKTDNSLVQGMAAEAIAEEVFSNPASQGQIVEHEGLEALLQICTGAEDPKAIIPALWALRNTAYNNQAVQSQIGKLEGVEVLLKVRDLAL
jgi:hypothetical protein